jgi:serralysin
MYFTGQTEIDALLVPGLQPHWNGTGTFNSAATVTFSFAVAPTPSPLDNTGQAAFTAKQEQAARLILQKWADVADITFVEVTDTGTFTGNSVSRGDINFINEALVDDDPTSLTLAFAFFPFGGSPKTDEEPGDVHVNDIDDNFTSLNPGGQSFSVLMHELGHSLGLNHPDEGIVSLPDDELNDRFSIMVPFVNDAVFFEQGVFATTPMLYDVLAIQHLYGANTTHNAGDTTYAFNDHDLFYECVWDAGGTDTFDASDTERRVILDLNEGQFSSIGTSPSGLGEDAEENVAIAFGVTIENGKGGLAGDTLIGNAGVNTLWGNGGGDSLVGRNGDDLLSGGSGLDRMDGGNGNDEFRVDETGDRVIERSGGGRDTVRATADFTLPNHVEVLRLTGAKAIDGTGNDGDNTIVGNRSANLIDGGDGDDRMIGLGGDDTYVVRQAGDQVVESAGAGFDTILSHITTTIAANVEMVVLAGNRRIDATGAAGDDILQGNRSANDLNGGGGRDVLIGGGGRDVLIGGGGGDTFRYVAQTDGTFVADNVTRGSAAGDRIVDFATGVDRFRFDAAAFDPDGALGNGLLTQGVDFSVIATQYNGTNAGANANHAAGAASFVFSTADRTLYFDADGAAAGYTVVATLDAGAVAATDIKIG